MCSPRIAAARLGYRLAYRILQLATFLTGRRGSGVKCLLTHSGRILLVRHTYGHREVWYLPGGGEHRGEQPLATGVREMREELGLENLQMRDLGRIQLRLEHVTVDLTCLHADLQDPRLRPNPVEIAHAGWFAPDRLPSPLGSEVKRLLAMIDPAAGTLDQRPLP
jgi:8-oxo-dGTP pyrophosphatase MutT (NUDIX family)